MAKKKPKTNGSGNTITIGVSKAAAIVGQYKSDKIDQACIGNLALLVEIRDNAMHFINAPKELSNKVYQISSATLNNFLFAAREWFQKVSRLFTTSTGSALAPQSGCSI